MREAVLCSSGSFALELALRGCDPNVNLVHVEEIAAIVKATVTA